MYYRTAALRIVLALHHAVNGIVRQGGDLERVKEDTAGECEINPV
jgi:hypothetical protein